MFGIGMPEMILILAIALIIIGPQKLPDLARSLGRAMREFKKATNELKDTIAIDSEITDAKQSFDSLKRNMRNNLYGDEAVPSAKDGPPTPDSAAQPAGAASPSDPGRIKDAKTIYEEMVAGEENAEGADEKPPEPGTETPDPANADAGETDKGAVERGTPAE